MTEKQKSFVYRYWGKTDLGQKMIASNSVTDDDLYFLIPNNVKRMNGLPLTRIDGKRKSVIKRMRKRQILSFRMFDIIEDLISEIIPEACKKNIASFADIKDFNK